MNKINSKFKYGKYIKLKLSIINKNDYIIMKLGQVNKEFILFYKFSLNKIEYNEDTIVTFIDEFLNNYKKL